MQVPQVATDAPRGGSSSSSICFASDSKKPDSPTAAYYTVNSGGTLNDVSKKTGIALSSLCQLNGLGRNAHLKSGQRIKLTQANLPVRPLWARRMLAQRFRKKPRQLSRQTRNPRKASERKTRQSRLLKIAWRKNPRGSPPNRRQGKVCKGSCKSGKGVRQRKARAKSAAKVKAKTAANRQSIRHLQRNRFVRGRR